MASGMSADSGPAPAIQTPPAEAAAAPGAGTDLIASSAPRWIRSRAWRPLAIGAGIGTIVAALVVAGPARWWWPAEPVPTADGVDVDAIVAEVADRVPGDHRLDDARARAMVAAIRADIAADRLEEATYGFDALDTALASGNLPALAAECAAVHAELVGGWRLRMQRAAEAGDTDEMLVASEFLERGTVRGPKEFWTTTRRAGATRQRESPRPDASRIFRAVSLRSQWMPSRHGGAIHLREAWTTFARGCAARLDRSGFETAVDVLRRHHAPDEAVAALWLLLAEESMVKGERDGARQALRSAELVGVSPERVAAFADPRGATMRVRKALRGLREGAAEEAVAACFDAVTIDRDAAVAALQEADAVSLLAAVVEACRTRFERAAADGDWAAAAAADGLARSLVGGSDSWLAEVLTGERLRALGPEFVMSLPADAVAALPRAAIGSVAPVHNALGMELALVQADGRPFFIGLSPVTNDQWQRLMGTASVPGRSEALDAATAKAFRMPRAASVADAPVLAYSRDEADEFCRRLTDLPEERAAGRVYRVASDEEWNCGVESRQWRGDVPSPLRGSDPAEPAEDSRRVAPLSTTAASAGATTNGFRVVMEIRPSASPDDLSRPSARPGRTAAESIIARHGRLLP